MATFDSIVSSRDPFGLDIRATGTYIQVKPKFSLSRNKVTDVAYYYFGWRKDGVGYLDIDKVNEGFHLLKSQSCLYHVLGAMVELEKTG